MSDYRDLQLQWTNWIRKPESEPQPEGDPVRLAIYRDLFFNNVKGFLDATFPVCASLCGEQEWQALSRQFFSSHRCHSPYFLDIPAEFLQWLNERNSDGQRPWLPQLAHYEWLELAMDIAPETVKSADPEHMEHQLLSPDALQCRVTLSPVAEGHWYQYPVHRLSAEQSGPAPAPTGLIVFRNVADEVCFVEVSAFTLLLFQHLQSAVIPLRDVILSVLEKGNIPASDAACQGAVQVLLQWIAAGLIIDVN